MLVNASPVGGCQNYGPLLDPYYNTAPPAKKDHNFDSHPYRIDVNQAVLVCSLLAACAYMTFTLNGVGSPSKAVVLVIAIVVQILGKYMIIGYLEFHEWER